MTTERSLPDRDFLKRRPTKTDLPPGEVFVRQIRGGRSMQPFPPEHLPEGFDDWAFPPSEGIIDRIRAGVGSRPEWPTGEEFVREVRRKRSGSKDGD